MFLSHSFDSVSTVRNDFEMGWKDLLDFINRHDVVAAPYRVKAEIYTDLHLDVELRVYLERRQREDDDWKCVNSKIFHNTNDAGKFGLAGEAYRIFWGRTLTLAASASGPMPLMQFLKITAPEEAREVIRQWARQAVEKDQNSRPRLRLVINN